MRADVRIEPTGRVLTVITEMLCLFFIPSVAQRHISNLSSMLDALLEMSRNHQTVEVRGVVRCPTAHRRLMYESKSPSTLFMFFCVKKISSFSVFCEL